MSTDAPPSGADLAERPPPPPSLRGGGGGGASSTRLLRWSSGGVAVLPLLGLAFIIVVLAIEALPALRYNGLRFFTHTSFNLGSTYGGSLVTSGGVRHPPGADYGILGWLLGTVLSTAIAVVVAVPVSVLGALALVFRLPRSLGTVIGFVLELLAGIPSVVIGLWGALTLGPILARDVYPTIASVVGGTPSQQGLLTSGLVLAMMIIPIVAATTRDLLRTVPTLQRDGAAALGMTDWEVTRAVTLPWVASGVIGAAVLGIARALGETMAVAMVSGVVLSGNPTSLFAPITTIAATIVTQLDSALTDTSGLAVRALAEAALVLAVITLAVNVLARLLVKRVAATGLPVGRGI
jgi:phosphate transport system permease protein